MKMSWQHYDALKAAIERVLADRPTPGIADWTQNYEARQLSPVRIRWDLVWATPHKWRQGWFDEVYTYCNDDHIDTALRRIIKELENA